MAVNRFFPSFAQLSSLLRVKADALDSKRKIAVSGDLLKHLITLALANVEFDDEWYKSKNPDLREALERGRISDLAEHFVTAGYFENRTPHEVEFDEQWYLQAYPDVRDAIAAGKTRSAKEHYIQSGQFEWRVPNAKVENDLIIWARLASS
ncbi:hypothetical protein [Bradyrhizobium guangzhouense]|uniref:hypothetical protein n=1 Tax=Bradyrhizobium guangzhouense TaxID=1325095 RepID=UPI001009FC15|nr:hypothetical protein [Bradyrhizobium guangzhouense]